MGYLRLKDGLLKSILFNNHPKVATRDHFQNIRLDEKQQHFEYTTFY